MLRHARTKKYISPFRNGNQMLQHEAPKSWISESEDNQGGFTNNFLGSPGKFARGLRRTPRRSYPQDNATKSTLAPSIRLLLSDKLVAVKEKNDRKGSWSNWREATWLPLPCEIGVVSSGDPFAVGIY